MSSEPELNFKLSLNETTNEPNSKPTTTLSEPTSLNAPTQVEVESEAEADEKLLKRTVKSFQSYNLHVINTLKLKLDQANQLFQGKPLQQQSLRPIYLNKLAKVGAALKANGTFLTFMVKQVDLFDMQWKDDKNCVPTLEDMDRVNTTLKQILRDWSSEGSYERSCSYKPLLDELERKFSKVTLEGRHKLRVLVPGAGLGRLAFDISSLGFSCQGNEFSYFMLLASNFLLNQSTELEQFTIHPYATYFSNTVTLEHQILPCKVPDVLPRLNNPKVDFSMVAGEFLEVYGHNPEQHRTWDSVVTCFFIDTAHNVADYVDAIWNLLKPGSPWINLGPLLYHYEGVPNQLSLELTFQELKFYIQKVGFKVENEVRSTCPYTANRNSLHVHQFECVQFTAIKPLH